MYSREISITEHTKTWFVLKTRSHTHSDAFVGELQRREEFYSGSWQSHTGQLTTIRCVCLRREELVVWLLFSSDVMVATTCVAWECDTAS